MTTNQDKLRAFLASHNLTTGAFAAQVGVRHAATISLWTTGARTPSLAAASRIEMATAGFVRAVDWAKPSSRTPPPRRKRAA